MTDPDGADRPFAAVADGVRLAVRVTPRASRSALGGLGRQADGRPVVLVRLAAPPVDGAANEALIRLLAAALDCPRGSVSIRTGEASRTKIVHLAGDPEHLLRRLDRWLSAGA